MSATARGIREHEGLHLHESIHSLALAYGRSQHSSDRLALIMDLMIRDDRCTPAEAIAAADRILGPLETRTTPGCKPGAVTMKGPNDHAKT